MKHVIIFCAHSDDEAVGMGGTIQKFVDEGFNIVKIVFSFGEASHPHLKEKLIIKKRVFESEKIAEKFGIKKTIFLGLTDGKIKEEVEKYNIKDKIKKLIRKYRPIKIFVPSENDPHPDHKAVNKIVLLAIDELKKHYEVYSYEVWNLVKEEKPTMYVDISRYMGKKLEFMKSFESQKHFIWVLLLPVIIRGKIYGFKNGCRYAEKFYKLR